MSYFDLGDILDFSADDLPFSLGDNGVGLTNMPGISWDDVLSKASTDDFDWTKLSNGIDWSKLGGNLLSGAKGVLQGAVDSPWASLLTGLAAVHALKGGGKSVGGYSGPGIDMGMKLQRKQIAQPKYVPYSGKPVMGRRNFSDVKYAAEGGLMEIEDARYLRGPTDGMADEVPAHIDGERPAALSHGEFVWPADVVSHLGNGNSEAGAALLDEAMRNIRAARTGSEEQAPQIDAKGMLDSMFGGGIAEAFAGGGNVTPTAPNTTQESNLATWAGPYVTNMLSQTQALANSPYEAYKGPLTAGPSPLQQDAFSMYDTWKAPTGTYKPTTFQTGLGDVGSVESYMNPYTQNVTDILAREQRRQSDIGRMNDNAKLAQAGGYGGSRQALMNMERDRNLMQQIEDINTKGLQSAWDFANKQRLAESDRFLEAQKGTEASRQFGANYGLDASKLGLEGAKAVMDAGTLQRNVEQEGIDARKKQFDEERMWPYQNLEFMQKMLSGLPVGASTNSGGDDIFGQISGLMALFEMLKNGKPSTTGTSTTPTTSTTKP